MSVMSETGKPLKGRHVLFWMMAFFGVMFVVNGIFLYYAITTHPGESERKSYVQGLDYNSTLAARAEQDALGWSAEIGTEGRTLVFRLYDREGRALTAGGATAFLDERAATHAADERTLAPQADGSFTASLDGLTPGAWDVRIEVTGEDGETLFTAHKMIRIP